MRNYGLTKYKENIYSQYGEDGMLKEALESLGVYESGFFVDVGSWDGIYLSNVYRLAKDKKFQGICIEANSEKYKQLKENLKNYNVNCVNSFVSLDKDSNLEFILDKNSAPIKFDLLSIDIDGNDWWVWESLKKYQPKIVIIEYNANHNSCCVMPYDKNFIHDNSTFYGATPPALMLLAEHKNYDLVGINHVNMIFIKKEINVLPKISISDYKWFGKWANDTDKKMTYIDKNFIINLP